MNHFQEKTGLAAEKLAQIKIVPVLVLNSMKDALHIFEILNRVGLKAAEITFRTKEAENIIREAARCFPELYLGAGTILNTGDLHRAFNAGASFAVAPGFNPTIVKEAVNNDFAFAPGICTPSEVEQACELGCRFMKFFPAEAAGGVAMLKSIIAPYRHLGLRFMPTGGINSINVDDYLAIKEVAAVGGTWLGKSEEIANGNWQGIECAVRGALDTAKKYL